jgi:hypothetical protein
MSRAVRCLAIASAAAAIALSSSVLAAAVETPRVSPAATVTQKVGTTDLVIRYHRPAVKGRPVWGGLVPYGEVWRLGANNASTIELSDDAQVAGQPLAAGTYALFAIPGAGEWTLILNRRAQQWGAFSYDPAQDALRFTVRPEKAPHAEWMTFTVTPTAPDAAEVALHWETLRVAFPVRVDVPRIVWGDLDAALAATPGDGDLLLQAARYAIDSGQRLDEAMGWIDRAIAAGEGFWNLETKADLLHREGRTAEAIPLLARAIELSRGKTPAAYQQGLEQRLAEWRAAAGS